MAKSMEECLPSRTVFVRGMSGSSKIARVSKISGIEFQAVEFSLRQCGDEIDAGEQRSFGLPSFGHHGISGGDGLAVGLHAHLREILRDDVGRVHFRAAGAQDGH